MEENLATLKRENKVLAESNTVSALARRGRGCVQM